MKKIFTVFDSKADAYLQPFFMDTPGMAERAFSVAVNDTQHDFNRFAEDYTLYMIGEFDEHKGVIVPMSTPATVGRAIQFLKGAKTEESIVSDDGSC